MFAQYARPSHLVWHLSDTHLNGGLPLYGTVDALGGLEHLFRRARDRGMQIPDAVVVTGDLADHGDADSYRRLRAVIEPATQEWGTRLIWVMGNHDSRAVFRVELLDEEPDTAPIDRVDLVNGLRIITLDTTVPGRHHGEIGLEQLEWLAGELSAPAEHGTLLAMHHPPLPSVLDAAVLVELREQAALAQVLRGTDVRGILAGHLHLSTFGTFAGIPVSVAAATCYTQDLMVAPGALRARDGAQAFNLVHVHRDTVLHTVSPLEAGTTIRELTPDETAEQLLQLGVVIPTV